LTVAQVPRGPTAVAGFGTAGPAGAGRGWPSPTSQVHPGQPHPSAPARRVVQDVAWRDQGPGRLRPLNWRGRQFTPGGHRRLGGAGPQGPGRPGSPRQAEIAVGLGGRGSCFSWSTPRVGANPTRTEGGRPGAAPGGPSRCVLSREQRWTTAKSESRRPSRWWSLGLRRAGDGSSANARPRQRRHALTMHSASAAPEAPPERLGAGGPRRVRADSAVPMSASRPCSQAGRRGSAPWSTRFAGTTRDPGGRAGIELGRHDLAVSWTTAGHQQAPVQGEPGRVLLRDPGATQSALDIGPRSAVVLIDASEPLTRAGPAPSLSMVHRGRAVRLVIAYKQGGTSTEHSGAPASTWRTEIRARQLYHGSLGRPG